MQCPKCGSEFSEDIKFCPQCGTEAKPVPATGVVKSVEEWKLQKSEEKDMAKKFQVAREKEKLEAIKKRMYKQQAGVNMEKVMLGEAETDENKAASDSTGLVDNILGESGIKGKKKPEKEEEE